MNADTDAAQNTMCSIGQKIDDRGVTNLVTLSRLGNASDVLRRDCLARLAMVGCVPDASLYEMPDVGAPIDLLCRELCFNYSTSNLLTTLSLIQVLANRIVNVLATVPTDGKGNFVVRPWAPSINRKSK